MLLASTWMQRMYLCRTGKASNDTEMQGSQSAMLTDSIVDDHLDGTALVPFGHCRLRLHVHVRLHKQKHFDARFKMSFLCLQSWLNSACCTFQAEASIA